MASPRGFARYSRAVTSAPDDDDGVGARLARAWRAGDGARALAWAYALAFALTPAALTLALALTHAQGKSCGHGTECPLLVECDGSRPGVLTLNVLCN